jgi:hypothetical protein
MRDELSEVAVAVLKFLDALRSQFGFSYEDMIYAVAASVASLPQEYRERFREAFDQIDKEMNGPKSSDAADRLS